MSTQKRSIRATLSAEIQKENEDSLRCHVLEYVLDRYYDDEEIIDFFQILSKKGCQGGMVDHLIAYHETDEFYLRYYDEIKKLREQIEERQGAPFEIKRDTRSFLAWLGFEETASRIARDCGIDV